MKITFNKFHLAQLYCCIWIAVSPAVFGCGAWMERNSHGPECKALSHSTYIDKIRFSKDGTRLFSQGDLDGQLISWDLSKVKPERVLVKSSLLGRNWDFEVSPVDSVLACTMNGDLYLYDYEEHRKLGLLKGQTSWLVNPVFIDRGRYLSAEGAVPIKIWEVKTLKQISSLNEMASLLSEVPGRVPGGGMLVFSFNDTVFFVDIDSKKELQRIKTSSGGGHVSQALFTSDGKRGFALSEKGYLSYFNVETGEVTASFQVYLKYKVSVGKIILEESKNRLWGISMSYKGFAVSIFDLEKGELLKVISRDLPFPPDRDPNAGYEILDAVISPDGQTLAIAGEDCQILLLDIETLETKGVLGKGCQVAPRSYRDSMKIN